MLEVRHTPNWQHHHNKLAARSVQPSEQLQGPADLPTPVQPQVGEQWEEFLRYALDLQRRLAQGGCGSKRSCWQGSFQTCTMCHEKHDAWDAESGVPLQPEPCQQRQSVTDVPDQKQSILNRLLRREAPATGGYCAYCCQCHCHPSLRLFLQPGCKSLMAMQLCPCCAWTQQGLLLLPCECMSFCPDKQCMSDHNLCLLCRHKVQFCQVVERLCCFLQH